MGTREVVMGMAWVSSIGRGAVGLVVVVAVVELGLSVH
jgi:hypothetical protein